MKKRLCIIASVLMIALAFIFGQASHASQKATESRVIAIVFDNSGSMYYQGNMAWCRATYAMEVFASMLNKGDKLMIHPMHPITVGGSVYTMDDPFVITDSSEASKIRDIYTDVALGTPIESVDVTIQSLKRQNADKKYMIVLTDGDVFYMNDLPMNDVDTRNQLDSRFRKDAGPGMTIMYLGIGDEVVMPDTPQSEYFVKKQAINSTDVLSSLTDMCNLIFGRDTLPNSCISGNKVQFDISLDKLIVFVQGDNVSNLKVVGSSGNVGKLISSASTKYGTAGDGTYTPVPDTSLQGMIVTYSDCDAGNYTIEYSGTATSISAYYEPNADLNFIFTDADGNAVDPKALYEGDYKVSFGMIDAKTGKLIESELLGSPHYHGNYCINGKSYPIDCDGYSGEIPVSLKMNDSFDATLTVTYLSGYMITKDSSDFGWPDGGIVVVSRPAGDLKLEISGGDAEYSLQDLEGGSEYSVKVYYQGVLLTGDQLKSVELTWDPGSSNAMITKDFADDHYNLKLSHKDPSSPQNTVCGDCTVKIYAKFSEEGRDDATAQAPLTYRINEDASIVNVELDASETYIVIADLEESHEITAKLSINGEPVPDDEFDSVDLTVDCGGIEYTLTPNKQDSSYSIKLHQTDGITPGNYDVSVKAQYSDHIGRMAQSETESVSITLSNMPLWLEWLIWLSVLALMILFVVLVMHIKVLPSHVHADNRNSTATVDSDDATNFTTFNARVNRGRMNVSSVYAGQRFGLDMKVSPGNESYLINRQDRRYAEVSSESVRGFGNVTITDASVAGVSYELNEDTGRLERSPQNDRPYNVRHRNHVEYSGNLQSGQPFSVSVELNYR